ncbi:O-antigen ligase family protein [candidate division CSSED10-310 bacterium]|uniref:O-antigen ligase family protein n=1 Tax=candidate division CSSED10-310 bacterium TaxID=2855610 RepID=A0ABV6Z4N7_UNCC1
MRPGNILILYLFLLPLIPADANIHIGVPWTHDRILICLLALALLRQGVKTRFQVQICLPMLASSLVLLSLQVCSLQYSVQSFTQKLFPIFSFVEQAFLLYACVNLGRGPEGQEFRTRACQAIVLSGSLLAVIGVFETVRGIPIFPTDMVHLRGSILRATASMVNPIRFGALLTMILPLAIGQAMKKRDFWSWCQAVMIAVGALSSLSRSTYLALILVLLLGFFWWSRADLQHWRRRSVFFVTPLLALALVLSTRVPGFMSHKSLINVTNRIYMAKIALDIWRQHPFFGIGLQNFPHYAPKYHIYGLNAPRQVVVGPVKMDPNPPFSPLISVFPDQPPIPDHPWAENAYLALAAEMGSIGLLAYLWWVILGLVLLWKFRGQSPREGYLLGCVVFLFVSLFFDTQLCFILIYEYWAFLGLGLSSPGQPQFRPPVHHS